jgi:hypothetical protein
VRKSGAISRAGWMSLPALFHDVDVVRQVLAADEPLERPGQIAA